MSAQGTESPRAQGGPSPSQRPQAVLPPPVTGYGVSQDASIRHTITRMDANRRGIVLVVDDVGRLVGTVTDGDVRRAILARVDLEQPVTQLLARKAGSRYATPITAPAGADRAVYLKRLKQHDIIHLPLVNARGQVVDLVTLDEFIPRTVEPLQALIMAGGKGSRLAPLTEQTPKSMLLVGNRPLMEIIIERLRMAGIRRVNIATHHHREKITQHFGDGEGFGIELTYVEEARPLGTAGALSLMTALQETLLVINGDILTNVDFRAMLAYHREHRADLTVAVRHHEVRVPYGVVECEGPIVRRIDEKPVVGLFVNAGIYLLEPIVYHYIPNGQPCDMPELIRRVLEAKRSVVSFPIREYWLDIGQPEDYAQAQEEVGGWGTPCGMAT